MRIFLVAVIGGARSDLTYSNDTVVTNTFTYANVTVNVIDHVLNIPLSFSQSVPYANESLFGIKTALSQVSVPVFNSSTNSTSNQTLFEVLDQDVRGFTLFAPDTKAFVAAQANLTTLAANQTAVAAILENHVRLLPNTPARRAS